MPAFKDFLSEDQRWDVLAYVHATFHGGFLPTSVSGEGTVIAVVPASEELVVKHGDIKMGWSGKRSARASTWPAPGNGCSWRVNSWVSVERSH